MAEHINSTSAPDLFMNTPKEIFHAIIPRDCLAIHNLTQTSKWIYKLIHEFAATKNLGFGCEFKFDGEGSIKKFFSRIPKCWPSPNIKFINSKKTYTIPKNNFTRLNISRNNFSAIFSKKISAISFKKPTLLTELSVTDASINGWKYLTSLQTLKLK